MLGKKDIPLGRIWLNVTFGQPDNFCKEPLTFEVVDSPSAYHALLGRPYFAKFMAIPDYTYLKLKMPGLKRVITIEGCFEQAYYCEQECVAQAAMLIAPCGLISSSHDIGRALVEEATKATAALDQPSVGEADKAPGGSGGSAGPSI
ncbi:uncharacterized protein [Miscanthus floridulus]|uniref:uncharacterized protein n=1 Tax=Miscanthus floridulus TaxID=154761 RepID=UPI003457B4F3